MLDNVAGCLYTCGMYRQIRGELSRLIDSERQPVILVLGMRQAGKTTLVKDIVGVQRGVYYNFELLPDRQYWSDQSRHRLEQVAARHKDKIVVIDEVQVMPEATVVIKHLYDSYRTRFVLTGSSELRIRFGVGDSLAGRIHEVRLYPLSLTEINIQNGLKFDINQEWNNYDQNLTELVKYLTYGSMPEIQNLPQERNVEYLRNYTNTLLSKDLLELGGMRKPVQVYRLMQLLAGQIGQLVNFNELAQMTEMSRVSVVRYVGIFEQMGLVVRARPISTNERESISKATKIYFTDLGVRNSLVDNFSWETRTDKGQLLENAVFMGLRRQIDYSKKMAQLGFFRSSHGAEIDIVYKTKDEEKLYEVKLFKLDLRGKKGVELVNFDNAQKFLY